MSEDITDNVFKSILEKSHGRYIINSKHAVKLVVFATNTKLDGYHSGKTFYR